MADRSRGGRNEVLGAAGCLKAWGPSGTDGALAGHARAAGVLRRRGAQLARSERRALAVPGARVHGHDLRWPRAKLLQGCGRPLHLALQPPLHSQRVLRLARAAGLGLRNGQVFGRCAACMRRSGSGVTASARGRVG